MFVKVEATEKFSLLLNSFKKKANVVSVNDKILFNLGPSMFKDI